MDSPWRESCKGGEVKNKYPDSAPFDIENDKLFCAWDGKQCTPMGHMFSTFLLCPDHGEFTWAPVVIFRDGKWQYSFHSATDYGMYSNAKAL